MHTELKRTVASPDIIEPEYYYFALDKHTKHPLRLIADVGAFRLKKNALPEQINQIVKEPLFSIKKENITIYALQPDQDFYQLTESSKKQNSPFCLFPVFQELSSGNMLILMDEIILHFQKETPDNIMEQIIQENGLEKIRRSRFAPNEHLLRVLDSADFKPLYIANSLSQLQPILFSAPNFLMAFAKE